MLRLIFLIVDLLATVLFSVFLPVDSLAKCWIPIVFFAGLYVALYVVFYFLLYIIAFFFRKEVYKKQNPFVRFCVTYTLEWMCHFCRVKVKVEGAEKLPKDQRFLLVYNHRSNFDPIVAAYQLRKYDLVHVSKPENFKIPVAGPFIRRNCYLAIDRDNAAQAIKTINQAAAFISSGSFSVGIAPEGTRNKTEEPLLPFRNGAFKIALKAKCPIVVCCFQGLGEFSQNFPFKRTNARMIISKVLPYEQIQGMKTNEIGDIVREEMLRTVYGVSEKTTETQTQNE